MTEKQRMTGQVRTMPF